MCSCNNSWRRYSISCLDAVSTNGNGFVHFKIFKLENELKIQVNDNGPGIATGMKDKIYEIGTTTKTSQRGVGMYVVKKIIDEAKGTIEFCVNNGTCWDISIPLERSIRQ
ncbi:ATP-binding protein [Clostridium estertheticum]|uniref:ATP-binding protein n=1 Tax=Clostridium estertheticum TaxID=238834 RepID=UPI001C0C2D17|nr:ATP-binding protein [Clostridium estertheticum]MBU3172616.1 GHKL domain-containing protein [Clostridium estertheticum]